MSYVPKLNDYVRWKNSYTDIEGWVYFVDNEYITIEISVKDKCEENIKDCPIHKKTHCCVVCHPQYWSELEYIKSRASRCNIEDCYKSQPYRYSDP
jgi:hypothetical protein